MALGGQGNRAGPALAPASGRLHWIDWLRVLAITGVVLYHTLRPFNTDDWHVKNAETSALLNDLTTFFASFGLAVLFLLAGAGVRFALRRRTWQAFLRERTARLMVPFVMGTLLLSPFQGWLEAMNKGTFPNPATDLFGWWSTVLTWATARGVSPTAFGIGYHLWFLGFLFAMSVVALPLCLWLVGPSGSRLVRALAGRFTWPGASIAVVIPIYVLMGIGSALGTEQNDWFAFLWYLGYFLIGFVLVSDERFLQTVRRDLGPAVVVAALATGLIVAGIPGPLATVGANGVGPVDLAIGFLFAAMGWSWTLLILNGAMRAGRLQRPVPERVGDAVLPLYVIHQPVILAVAFVVVQWPLGILPKWLAVLAISVPLTLLMVELVLRAPITRLLIGARVRPSPPRTPGLSEAGHARAG